MTRFHGELVKKVTVYILFVPVGLALFFPPGAVAHADRNFEQGTAQKNSSKSWKKYMKQEKKEQKREHKSQTRAMKDWKEKHPTAH